MATTTETLKSVTGSIQLAAGNTSAGTVKTVSVSMGSALNPETFDKDKMGNIIYDLIDVLAYSLYASYHTDRYQLLVE